MSTFNAYNLCVEAAKNGRLDILIFLHKNKCPWDEWTCFWAAHNGHLDCLKYAHDNGCLCSNERACSYAVYYGHLECLKYLHENGCPWNTETCVYAARMGRIECLKYAHENGCSWDKDTCSAAALQGNLNCLKYLHENGCHWDADTCICAAENGHLECLKYAHENGCPWNKFLYYHTAHRSHNECLKYAHKNGCPYPKELMSTIVQKILIPKWRAIFKIYQFIIYLKKRNVQKANTALRIIIDTIINDNRSLVDRIVEINYKIDKYKEIADTYLLKQTRKVKAQLDQLRCFEKKSIKPVGNVSNLNKQVHDDTPKLSVDEDRTCIVCMVESKSHLAVPCGHQLACKKCSSELSICPICREPVKQWVMVRIV